MAQVSVKGKMCVLCPEGNARPAVESHHVAPVEFGGAADGLQIPLCPNCHTDLHTAASAVAKGQKALSSVGDPRWHRAIKAIVDQMALFSATRRAPDARRRIVAHLTEQEQTYARLVKNHHGFSSLEKMIKALITREAERIASGRIHADRN